MTGRNLERPALATLPIAAALALGGALLLLTGCADWFGPRTEPSGFVAIRVSWPGADALASGGGTVGTRAIPGDTERLRITVTGQGMAPVQVEITRQEIQLGTAIERIAVPAGIDRLIEAEALDAQGKVLAAGRSRVTVNAGTTAYARVVLVKSTGSEPPPEVLSRTLRLTSFEGNFTLLRKEVTPQSTVPAPELPPGAQSGTLTLDFFPANPTGTRPIVGTLTLHNQFELWVIRGYAEAIPTPSAPLNLQTGITNDYITNPGGYTTSFTGSLLNWDLIIGPILDIIRGPGHITIDFGNGDWLTTPEVRASADVSAGAARSLIGSLDGQLVF